MNDRLPRFHLRGDPASLSPHRLGPASTEAWPAAGGGLLVGMSAPGLAGLAPLRMPLKTIFLRIGSDGDNRLIFPYVRLEPEAGECARVLSEIELGVPEGFLAIFNPAKEAATGIADLAPSVEDSLRCCAAIARTLLASAAANTWRIAMERCVPTDRLIRPYVQSGRVKALAADAALCRMPRRVELRCGRRVDLAASTTRHDADTKVCSILSCK
jgi:hypothetical protein